MTTYADIETRVLKNINSTTADVSVAVDNAIDFLGNFYENYKIDTSIPTVANQDYIARPTLCKEVERVEIGGDEIKKGAVAQLQEIKDFDLERFIEYDGKINLYPTPDAIATTKIWYKALFTPLAGVAAAVTDVPKNLLPLLITIATWFFLEQQQNIYDYTGADGWIEIKENTWAFLSATEITVDTGAASRFYKNWKIKLEQAGTTKYFIIKSVADTVLTITPMSGYTLTNAIISNRYYSTVSYPYNFPNDPTYGSVNPTGHLINGQIVPTVVTDHLVVSIKTLAGGDPSVTDPVTIRIGNAVRKIIAPLSVTLVDGVNWFNAGSTELAAKEIDYFVYIGYNVTDGVVLGISRISYAEQYSDFHLTTTNEKHCKISTITTAAANDVYVNCGRLAATLGVGATYLWTVPTFVANNLIQRPIYETRWLTFVITPSGSGAMTVGTLISEIAKYKIIGNKLTLDFAWSVTTAGAASNEINFVWPFTPDNITAYRWGISTLDSMLYAGHMRTNTTVFTGRRYDSGNFGIGVGRGLNGVLDYGI